MHYKNHVHRLLSTKDAHNDNDGNLSRHLHNLTATLVIIIYPPIEMQCLGYYQLSSLILWKIKAALATRHQWRTAQYPKRQTNNFMVPRDILNHHQCYTMATESCHHVYGVMMLLQKSVRPCDFFCCCSSFHRVKNGHMWLLELDIFLLMLRSCEFHFWGTCTCIIQIIIIGG